MPLATTPGGKAFCLKALHPSEHTIKTTRVPGGVFPSTAVASDQSVEFTTTDVTDLDIYQSANPCILAQIRKYEAGVLGDKIDITNPAFMMSSPLANPTSATLKTHMSHFLRTVERYRVTSQSITLTIIAPALIESGSILAAQCVLEPRECGMGSAGNSNAYGVAPMYLYETPPQYSTLLQGTSAYTAKLRDGMYMPLKINSFKWKAVNCPHAAVVGAYNELAEEYSYTVPIQSSSFFPYYEDRSSCVKVEDWAPVPRPCGHSYGIAYAKGIPAGVIVRLRVRQVVEISARPGSLYAPLLEAPLPPDELAMKMYHQIAASMSDAYPASYNDLGALRDLIVKGARKLISVVDPALKIISDLPGTAGTIGTVGTYISKGLKALIGPGKTVVVDKPKKQRRKKKAKKSVTVKTVVVKPRKVKKAAAAQA